MTTSIPRRPRVLCVGAYERDNFGDLLFQIITAQYLTDADVVYAAPFAADMTELIGLDVPAYGPLLEAESFDAVWTVGGEVGGTSVDYAYRTKHGEKAFRAYVAKTPAERRAILAQDHGAVPMESPYLPRASAYALNVGAASVLNSVGLAGARGLPAVRKAAVLGILNEATRIAVRDRFASAFLTEEGIDHHLEPDLVHSIAITRPQPEGSRGDYVLLQASIATLKKFGIESFAQAIIDSPVLRENPVRLFTAGTAPGHDSFEQYQQVLDLVLAADPDRRIEISRTIDPWERTDEIARAKLWIGSSLHGRIISCAYGVPRVSFSKRKVNDYIRTWDEEMPWGIDQFGMDEAAAKALAMKIDHRGVELGTRAHENILAAVAHVHEWAQHGAPKGRSEQIVGVRNQQWARLTLELAAAEAARKAAAGDAAATKASAARSTAPKPSLLRRARRRAGRLVRRAQSTFKRS